MPQNTKSKSPLSSVQAQQGLEAHASDPEALRKAIELAIDYRGDVTIKSRGASADGDIECFIFDVKNVHSDSPLIRAIPKNSDQKIAIPFCDIESIAFTGKDTAAGRSFDTWMKNYVKKKLAGEEASIESETLDS